MGKVTRSIEEKLIDPVSDRHSNRLKIHEDHQGEVTINFRNLKIVLHSREEIEEWKRGFTIGLQNLGDWFTNDI